MLNGLIEGGDWMIEREREAWVCFCGMGKRDCDRKGRGGVERHC